MIRELMAIAQRPLYLQAPPEGPMRESDTDKTARLKEVRFLLARLNSNRYRGWATAREILRERLAELTEKPFSRTPKRPTGGIPK